MTPFQTVKESYNLCLNNILDRKVEDSDVGLLHFVPEYMNARTQVPAETPLLGPQTVVYLRRCFTPYVCLCVCATLYAIVLPVYETKMHRPTGLICLTISFCHLIRDDPYPLITTHLGLKDNPQYFSRPLPMTTTNTWKNLQ